MNAPDDGNPFEQEMDPEQIVPAEGPLEQVIRPIEDLDAFKERLGQLKGQELQELFYLLMKPGGNNQMPEK